MDEILELKFDIAERKNYISERGKIQTPNCNMKNFKFQFLLLQQDPSKMLKMLIRK